MPWPLPESRLLQSAHSSLDKMTTTTPPNSPDQSHPHLPNLQAASYTMITITVKVPLLPLEPLPRPCPFRLHPQNRRDVNYTTTIITAKVLLLPLELPLQPLHRSLSPLPLPHRPDASCTMIIITVKDRLPLPLVPPQDPVLDHPPHHPLHRMSFRITHPKL